MELLHIRIVIVGSDESMPYGNEMVQYDTEIPFI